MGFHIGKNCRIHPSVVIAVQDGFIGEGAVINEGARIEGTRVEIGREAFLDRFATIGGGSCNDPQAFLLAGDWFHMGVSSHVNTARGVSVGHEFGCGIETKIFTHGAYIDSFNLGAPVQWEGVTIGDNVWLPNAWVNPGVKIGSNVVVAARSLVNQDLPDGCLAAGVPVKILKENWLPRHLTLEAQTSLVAEIIRAAWSRHGAKNLICADAAPVKFDNGILISQETEQVTVFDLTAKTISGPATPWTLILKDQLRRNGIRFRFSVDANQFKPWSS